MEAPIPVQNARGFDMGEARPRGLVRKSSKLQTHVEVLRCRLGKPNAIPGSDTTLAPVKNWTPIYYAVYHQREAALTHFLRTGGSPDDVDGTGQPPLCIATANGNVEIVKILLDAGANVDATTRAGETALHMAIKNNQTNIFNLLLEAGPELEVHTTDTNETPLHYAASKSGSLATIVTLLKLGAKYDSSNSRGQSPAEAALLANNIQGAVAIINASHGQRNKLLKEKELLLKHVERSQGRFSLGNELIADIFSAACDPDSTVLVEAIKRNDAGLVDMFLNKGADPDRATPKGDRPIFVALECAAAPVVQTLVKHKADLAVRDAKGHSVLQAAFEGSFAQDKDSMSAIFDCLLSNGAEATVTYPDGTTLLHRAVSLEFGYPKIAQRLLSSKVRVNTLDGDGNTALHLATHSPFCIDVLLKNGLSTIEILLMQKMDKDKRTSWNCVGHEDHDGHDALYYAITLRKVKFVEALLKSGAMFSLKEWIPGRGPLDVSVESEQLITRLLAQHEWSRRASVVRRQSVGPEMESQKSPFSTMFPVNDLRSMITMGLSPNALPKTSLGSSLMWAILRQIPLQPPLPPEYLFDALHLILEHRADPNVGTARGGKRTPSPQASAQDLPLTLHTMTFLLEEYPTVDADLVTLLLTKGTKLSLASPFYSGRYPLHSAVKANRIDLVDEFLLQRADINCVDFEGRSPLFIAAEKGFWEIADTLLNRGAKVDLKDAEGNTLLHAAAFGGSQRLVSVLLRTGCEASVVNAKKQTPLHRVPNNIETKERNRVLHMLKSAEEREQADTRLKTHVKKEAAAHEVKIKQKAEDEVIVKRQRDQRDPSPRIDSGFGQKRPGDTDKPLPVLDRSKTTLEGKDDKRNSSAAELADWLALSKMMDNI
ncbi:ankyrin repeat-containing domain protein [Phaeosphaeria sp. MPI-PUGE-AT-0046c]|nr:ankyrin repeat-containing domain protein [Phaeosphaeria sp. MPI-PUGE-AT-0046c]